MRQTNQLVAALLVGAAFCVGSQASVASDCYTTKEWQAAHVRVLQEELQVAALQCQNVEGHSYSAQYSAFVSQFQDRLRASGDTLHAHFRRVFGRSGDSELDRFVTRLANEAQERSMSNMTFCADSAPLFNDALSIKKPELETARSRPHYGSLHCRRAMPIIGASQNRR